MSNSTPPGQGTSKPSQHLDIPDNNLKHQSSLDSTVSADSTALPPFPPAGASPDTRSPAHPHQNAEDLLNAAAQHVFPEHPAPQRSPADERKGVTKEGRISPGDRDGSKRAKEGKAREEEPLLGGTPLDEMTPLKTPGILLGGQPGFPFPPKRTASSSTITPAHRQGSGDTLNAVAKGGSIGAIPENEPLQTDLPPMQSESQPDSAATVRRPDLRAHDYGSVCSFLTISYHFGRRKKRSELTCLSSVFDRLAPHLVYFNTLRIAHTTSLLCLRFHLARKQVRMGASALMSALNALPWDDDAEGSSSDSDDDSGRGARVPPPSTSAARPKGMFSISSFD